MKWMGSDALAGLPIAIVGCGFIGRRMVEMFSEAGHPVTALGLDEPPEELARAADRIVVGDAADREVLKSTIDGAAHVIWTAGGLMPREAELDPEIDRERTLGPLRTLASFGPELVGKTVTYMSSGGTVYGNPGREPVGEDHPPAPIGAYGRNKLLAEEFLQGAAAEIGFKLRILRCSNVYGPNQPSDRGQGAVAVFGDRIANGREIEVFGDGGAFRDYIHVDDVVRATALLWEQDGPVILNCGSGEAMTIFGLIEALERSLGRKAIITRLPSRGFDVSGVVLDISRIRSLIDFEPMDLETGLQGGLRLGAG